jgi:hypothetical protein
VTTPRPTRKTYRRPDLGIVRAAHDLDQRAPEIEVGWLFLREHLHDAGWPSRTPEDDKPEQRHLYGACGLCRTTFDTSDAYRYHRDETGHDELVKPEVPDSGGIDYSDTTGDQAVQGQALAWHRDLEALQDLRHTLEHTARQMVAITRRYLPGELTAAVPVCSHGACSEPVESRTSHHSGKVGYVGMEQIAGMWFAKVGVAPVCGKHRKRTEREAA